MSKRPPVHWKHAQQHKPHYSFLRFRFFIPAMRERSQETSDRKERQYGINRAVELVIKIDRDDYGGPHERSN